MANSAAVVSPVDEQCIVHSGAILEWRNNETCLDVSEKGEKCVDGNDNT